MNDKVSMELVMHRLEQSKTAEELIELVERYIKSKE